MRRAVACSVRPQVVNIQLARTDIAKEVELSLSVKGPVRNRRYKTDPTERRQKTSEDEVFVPNQELGGAADVRARQLSRLIRITGHHG